MNGGAHKLRIGVTAACTATGYKATTASGVKQVIGATVWRIRKACIIFNLCFIKDVIFDHRIAWRARLVAVAQFETAANRGVVEKEDILGPV